MSIRIKTFITIGIVVILMTIAVAVILDVILKDGLLRVEQDVLQHDLKRINDVLVRDELALRSTAISWVERDDVKSFTSGDKNASFKDLVSDETLRSLQTDMLLLMDEKGRVLYGRSIGLDDKSSVELDQDVTRRIARSGILNKSSGQLERRTGLIDLPVAPMVVASVPVWNEKEQGSSAVLVLGYYLHEHELAELGQLARSLIFIDSLQEKGSRPEQAEAVEALASGGQTHIQPLSESIVAGYQYLPDVNGKPGFLLTLEAKRAVFTHSASSLNVALLALVLMGLLSGAMMIFLVERSVIRRILKLSHAVKIASETGQPVHALMTGPNDEISVLAAAFNDTLVGIKSTHEKVLESEQLFRSISSSSRDAIVMLGPGCEIVYMNQAGLELFGINDDQLRNDTNCDRLLPECRNMLPVSELSAVKQQPRNSPEIDVLESTARRHDGKEIPIELTYAHVWHREEQNLVLVIRDISKRKSEQNIRKLRRSDELTNLANRTVFLETTRMAMADARRHENMIAVHFIDLDNFKDINESLGHEIGDKLLIGVARRLEVSLRREDTIARLGGDEFAVIQTNLHNSEQAALFAEKLIGLMNEKFVIAEHEIHMTPSIGIALFPVDAAAGEGPSVDSVTSDEQDDDPLTLFKHADTAAYRSKSHGRNTYCFYDESMSVQVEKKMSIVADLRRALKNSEFKLYYQPRFSLETGRILGAEALIRWHHPQRGLVLPGEFITTAEESGLIVPIGEWVLYEACRQNVQWQGKGFDNISVSINVSVVQFERQDIPALVGKVLAETGSRAENVEIEVTESCLAKNIKLAINNLKELRKMGVKVSIDDFGTGYSSLSYLRQLDIDFLKIDRAFIKDIGTPLDDGAISAATIALGHNLKMQVVAEGVETASQVDFLREHNCDQVQGYFFGKPMPVADLEELLEQDTKIASERAT